jgi:hypothetical protein
MNILAQLKYEERMRQAYRLAAFRRFFGTKISPYQAAGFADAMKNPAMQLLLNHFYEAEIEKPNTLKFDSVRIADGEDVYDDIEINNIN